MFGFVVYVVVVLLKKSILEGIICVADAMGIIWLIFVIIVMKQKFYVHEL